MSRFVVLNILFFVSFPSFASQTSQYSAPSYITVKSNNVALVWFPNSLRTGAIPSCTTVSGGYFALAFSLSTDAGKAMFQEILAAAAGTLGGYASPDGHAVTGLWAVGTGDCGVLAGTESLSLIIGPPGSGP